MDNFKKIFDEVKLLREETSKYLSECVFINTSTFKSYLRSNDKEVSCYASEIIDYFADLKKDITLKYGNSFQNVLNFVLLLNKLSLVLNKVKSMSLQMKLIGEINSNIHQTIGNINNLKDDIDKAIINLCNIRNNMFLKAKCSDNLEIFNILNKTNKLAYGQLLKEKKCEEHIEYIIDKNIVGLIDENKGKHVFNISYIINESDVNFEKIDFLISDMKLLKRSLTSYKAFMYSSMDNNNQKITSISEKQKKLIAKDKGVVKEFYDFIESLDEISASVIAESCFKFSNYEINYYSEDNDEYCSIGKINYSTNKSYKFFLKNWFRSTIYYYRFVRGN